jgi:hypothetical protein
MPSDFRSRFVNGTDITTIYFSDFFDVSADVLETYGAFDVSLIKDLPLFIDPFLLFNSHKQEYQSLHNEIIKYLRFLKDRSLSGQLNIGLMEAWFTFPEVKQTWLGYSVASNRGSGLGIDFARALNANLVEVFRDFGQETVTRSSHLEKLCLISAGVGRDNISDFATNLIKHHLLGYTQNFARQYLHPDQRRIVKVHKTRFNYDTEVWESLRFDLPFVNHDYVILTPVDLLTKDETWINRPDMVGKYTEVVAAVTNTQLRAQLNNYFAITLENIRTADDKARQERNAASDRTGRRVRAEPTEPSHKQVENAALETIRHFPEFIDHFIRWKEDHGDEAEAQADERVRSSERLYVAQVRELALMLLKQTGFYQIPGDTLDEARERVVFLKDVIENKGGYRLFYADGKPIRRESDLHILFRLTWCNTVSDVNREVNNGRGPSDFEVSRGRFDKSLVEFKLAKNTSLAKNLQHQVEIYKQASDAQNALKVIVFFTREERDRVLGILKNLGLDTNRDVIMIDARDDNKPSASKADAIGLTN